MKKKKITLINFYTVYRESSLRLYVKVLKPGPDRTVRPENPRIAYFYGSFNIKNRFRGKK